MSVTITIPTALRQFTGGSSRIEVEATTAAEALNRLTLVHAELRRHLYDANLTLAYQAWDQKNARKCPFRGGE